MDEPFFSTKIPSQVDAIAPAIEGAINSLLEQDWTTEDEVFFVRLCLEEALVNAVIHANQNDANRQVGLALYDQGEHCRIDVQDEGEGSFQPESVPEPDETQLRGRGLHLIKHFMNDVSYSEDRRTLTMTFRRKAFSQGGTCDD